MTPLSIDGACRYSARIVLNKILYIFKVYLIGTNSWDRIFEKKFVNFTKVGLSKIHGLV